MTKHILNSIKQCYSNISNDIIKTPLEFNKRLSKKYNTNIFYKREDLQITRSFKLRGSLNKIKNINKDNNNLICASAGNHAQGFAYSCRKLGYNGLIYVPEITPLQKINRIKYYGEDSINIKLFGNNFNECLNKALEVSNEENRLFIHPYDDEDIINGQSTISYEIYNDITPDFIIVPVGGGGLISGIAQYSKLINPKCKIIGVEPENANSLEKSIKNNNPTFINNVNTFVDGASVPMIGNKPFEICKNNIDNVYSISNQRVSYDLINCYQDDGIILEPAGALPLGSLDKLNNDYDLTNKSIVVILSGGNNDVTRYNEIIQLNNEYIGLTHYFIVEFNQVPGQLRQFINNIIDKDSDIIHFEYVKKTNKYFGNVLLGLQVSNITKLNNIITNMNNNNINFKKIEYKDLYYDILI